MTDNLILWELQKIHEALTQTKKEHTLNIRMIESTEKFIFSIPILNTTQLVLISLSFYKSLFNVNKRNNQFLYTSDILDSSSNPNASYNSSSNITSIPIYNNWTPISHSTTTPGAFELSEIAELIKEETDGNVIIEVDKNKRKCKMETKQGVLSFEVGNSVGSSHGFRKVLNKNGEYTTQKIVDIMGFNTTNIHCNFISVVKDSGNDTDILCTFNLLEPTVYVIRIIPIIVLNKNVTKDGIEYIKFHIKDEY